VDVMQTFNILCFLEENNEGKDSAKEELELKQSWSELELH
jgi:hypothetical protein